MIPLGSSRRSYVFLATVLSLALVLFLHAHPQPQLYFLSGPISKLKVQFGLYNASDGLEKKDKKIRERVERMKGYCEAEDAFEREYGRTNLRLARGYEGSHERMRLLLQKIMRGEPLTISAIGGSVTKGHQVWKNEIWFHKFWEWLTEFAGEDVEIKEVNGAAPATGSDYFSFCFPLHIPSNSDLVLVELAVNDEGIPEHVENMENLLRGLLDLPSKPAVMLVEAMAFSNGGMGGGGGRMHLPVAQYYDVPVINQRLPLVNHFARHPQLVRPYFAQDWWGNPDTRHINSHGHRDLGMLVASFVKDVACEMFSESTFHVQPPSSFEALSIIALAQPPQTEDKEDAEAEDELLAAEQKRWPEQSRSWRKNSTEEQPIGELMPGLWSTPIEYGMLPRLRVLEGWNPHLDYSVPPFHPTCLSTRAKEPRFNLTPSANEGWEYWVHPEHLDKPYLIARTPGARVSFELETSVGIVKMYALKSKTFGLGTIECWVDEERRKNVKIEGYWDNGNVNIGRFAPIRDNLQPGKHTVTCELLEETSDPGGGHEFRMISMMSM
ncbi:hypothetical protein I307_02196 [Cryptococcus deuterogattii 99/473]|uniref:Capsular associated protein n=2 Tax=Cryptococcus deuterogattii TaxID=1859096 RepID=A0A0D0UZU0_9TREE|nr:hypothetical protein CNBG_0432 [Cryptococcus deuterogattii R265]KIR27143.1 hypothetical protein I309_03853 [Cryptococcus deuterogattii LA55]KIR33687.1 hypothetical protein I352_03764 [Cryptococcus deuterogattii MMRL2647]KIR40761.1 hypothetical protein I313_03417 [Cryptococcus deuterogattii Ram5]KIR74442.1 hypothetical protein I310_02049 [Cryptococcus deuterogattii CA1014]KIR94069.1 hypothetical protein I304_01701 [Cryptococcus deuterogattii CBS 10090]KIS01076.1 hypothetical protein L804_00